MQERSADVIDLVEYRQRRAITAAYNEMMEYLEQHHIVDSSFAEKFYPGYVFVGVELVKDSDEPVR